VDDFMIDRPFPVKNGNTPSKECSGALSWQKINEQSLHNSPRLNLMPSTSLFDTSTKIVSLTVVPSGKNSKWTTPLMLKKQINAALILDFDICRFFGLGEFFDLQSMDCLNNSALDLRLS
jgi:hypothetical protein